MANNDPSPDFGLTEGFLPHLESGTASRPTRDSIIPTYGGADLHADPSPGFRRLMEEFLHPETPPVSSIHANMRSTDPHTVGSVCANMRSADSQHMGREASVCPGPLRKIHSPEHVLLECPLTEPYRHLIRDSILGTVNVRNLFYTIKGAKSLATFLLRSNSLLRPLPPRPDPP